MEYFCMEKIKSQIKSTARFQPIRPLKPSLGLSCPKKNQLLDITISSNN